MSLMRVWGALGGANQGHTCSKAVSPRNQAKYNEYTPEERAKMVRYGAINGPSKVTKHFSLLLDGKLTCRLCCRHVIFLVEGLNLQIKYSPNLMIRCFGQYRQI